MTMTKAERFAMLAQRNAEARAKKILLKDCTPDELLIGCDYTMDVLNLSPEIDRDPVIALIGCRYLKYASKAQIDALRGFLPHAVMLIAAPVARAGRSAWYERVVFNGRFINHVLNFLSVHERTRYLSHALYPAEEDFARAERWVEAQKKSDRTA